MNDAVASLQAIRDGFAALREELAETKQHESQLMLRLMQLISENDTLRTKVYDLEAEKTNAVFHAEELIVINEKFKQYALERMIGEIETLNAANARIAELEAARASVCAWEYDNIDGYWQSTCGLLWVMEDTPIENQMNFCPNCGNKLWVSSVDAPEETE